MDFDDRLKSRPSEGLSCHPREKWGLVVASVDGKQGILLWKQLVTHSLPESCWKESLPL